MAEQIDGNILLEKAKKKRSVGYKPELIAILCGYTTENDKEADMHGFTAALIDAIQESSSNGSEDLTIEERLKSTTLEDFLAPHKSEDSKPCHIYLVDSGNYDNVYKIGYTCNKRRRLTQIKDEYGVPNAVLQASAYVRTVQSAKAVEGELHLMFSSQRVNTYYGEEWFQLNTSQVDEIKNFLTRQTSETQEHAKIQQVISV